MPFKPAYYQNKLDRLNTMAQRRPLNQAQQQTVTNLQNKMGVTPIDAPQDFMKKLGLFGDTSVPNVNTIGASAPSTPQSGGPQLPGGTPQGGPISGPGPGLMGGVAAPGTSNMPNAPLPPGAMYKKGGYVGKNGKLNLGSGRVSTATKNKKSSTW